MSISIRLYLNQQLFCVDPKIAAFSSTTYASQLRIDTREECLHRTISVSTALPRESAEPHFGAGFALCQGTAQVRDHDL